MDGFEFEFSGTLLLGQSTRNTFCNIPVPNEKKIQSVTLERLVHHQLRRFITNTTMVKATLYKFPRGKPHCPIKAVSRREATSGINNAMFFAACMEIFNVVRDEQILNTDGKEGSQVVHVGKSIGSRSFFLYVICTAYSILRSIHIQN